LVIAFFAYFAGFATVVIVLSRRKRRAPQLVGAALPEWPMPIDLTKRYDIDLGYGYPGASDQELLGVRILGYLRSDRDESRAGYVDSRWLVVELDDGRKVYLKPHEIRRLQESR
jgi:hypothetical protein